MKFSCLALTTASLVCLSNGFSVAPINTRASPSSVRLDAKKNEMDSLTKGAASFAVAFALGWGMSSPSLAATMPQPSFLETTSTVTIAAEYADFSMPSYQSALVSPINTNLTGGEMNAFSGEKMADKSAAASETSAPVAAAPVVDEAAVAKKAAQAAEDKKDAKEAAKAAQKASREKQKAAADAAMAAAKASAE